VAGLYWVLVLSRCVEFWFEQASMHIHCLAAGISVDAVHAHPWRSHTPRTPARFIRTCQNLALVGPDRPPFWQHPNLAHESRACIVRPARLAPALHHPPSYHRPAKYVGVIIVHPARMSLILFVLSPSHACFVLSPSHACLLLRAHARLSHAFFSTVHCRRQPCGDRRSPR
jgi:hypothetical protein